MRLRAGGSPCRELGHAPLLNPYQWVLSPGRTHVGTRWRELVELVKIRIGFLSAHHARAKGLLVLG